MHNEFVHWIWREVKKNISLGEKTIMMDFKYDAWTFKDSAVVYQ